MLKQEKQSSIPVELKAALLSCHPDRETVLDRFIQLLSSHDFSSSEFVKYAKLYCLAPLIHDSLKTWQNSKDPTQLETCRQNITFILDRLDKVRLAFLVNSIKLKDETIRLLNILRDVGIWVIPLKGPFLAENIFGGVGLRVIGDIDLLVNPSDLDRSLEYLLKEGYSFYEADRVVHERAQSHHLKLFHPESKIVLELHWDLVQADRFPLFSRKLKQDESLWLQNRSDLTLQGLWLYLIIHHHEHAYGEFKTLIDCAWTAAALPGILDKADLAKTYDLHVCWTAVQQQLDHYLGHSQYWPSPDQRLTKVQQNAINKLMEIPREPGLAIYRRKLYGRLLIPRWTDIFRSAFRTVFPPKKTITFLGKFCRFKYLLHYFRRLVCNMRFEAYPGSEKSNVA